MIYGEISTTCLPLILKVKGGITLLKIDETLLDEIANLEVQALLDGLKDTETRKDPAFLGKVRMFLAQNKLQVVPETDGVEEIKRELKLIPSFEDDDEVNVVG